MSQRVLQYMKGSIKCQEILMDRVIESIMHMLVMGLNHFFDAETGIDGLDELLNAVVFNVLNVSGKPKHARKRFVNVVYQNAGRITGIQAQKFVTVDP